jgi:phage tail-like protein
MPAAQRNDPYRNFGFLVEIDGIASSGFSEVELPESSIEVVEYREGGDVDSSSRKLPGRVRYGNIVLKRGLTSNNDLWNWWNTIRGGKADRRDGAIVLLDSERQPVRRWVFRQGWPCKLDGPTLNAKGNEVVIEELELAIEALELAD